MWPRPGTTLNITATKSLALPSAVSLAPRTQSQRSQRSASFGRRCPQYGHGILSPVLGSGRAVGASVYSTFIFIENHKPHRIRQAKRDSVEEADELRVRAAFRNGMIFCLQCVYTAFHGAATQQMPGDDCAACGRLLSVHHHSSGRLLQFQLGAHLLNLRSLIFYCCTRHATVASNSAIVSCCFLNSSKLAWGWAP